MKKFLIKLFIFVFPILIISSAAEILLRNIPNDYQYKSMYLKNNSKNIETLILGHSHSYNGMNPDLFVSNAFNAAHSAQSLEYDLKILQKYDFDNLKTIIIPISYFSYFQKIDGARLTKYNLYYGFDISFNLQNLSELLSFSLFNNIKRLRNYYINGKDENEANELGLRIRGDKNVTDFYVHGLSRSEGHTYDDHSELNNNISILNEIIEFAKKKNANVILFTPPGYHSYTNNLNKEQLNIMYENTHNIVKDNDNCYYVDYLFDKDFLAEDYYDSDHLNEKGAIKLTLKIIDFINNLN